MEETHVHALDYLSVVRRRARWLIVPIVSSVVVGLLLVRFLPKEYTSSATLSVAAPDVSLNLVNQAQALDNEERLRAISQQLMSPEILARVAKEEGLVAGTSVDAVVTKMRKKVEITVPEPVAQTNERRQFDAFIVSYIDDEPGRAQRVANRIASVFVDENAKTRTGRAESTSAFIQAQLHASEARLADLEGRLRKSKEVYMGQLPEQTQANLATVNGLRQQLETNATALRSEQDRLSYIEKQIDGMQKGSNDLLIVPKPGGEPATLAQTPETRVMVLERELAIARGMYTEKHPEVQALLQELAEARRDALAEQKKPVEERNARLRMDPAYRQLVADREMSRLQIRERQRQDADIQRQIGMYQARVERAPMVEQQLASVQRDFDLQKIQYNELSAQLHRAQISESVERNRRGEQFAILYTASWPTEKDVRPVPWRVMLISVLAGICLGGALTLGREYLDRSVHSARDLKDEFQLPVLGEVARIQPA
jgi:polysaccharide biosynthesis transport protein